MTIRFARRRRLGGRQHGTAEGRVESKLFRVFNGRDRVRLALLGAFLFHGSFAMAGGPVTNVSQQALVAAIASGGNVIFTNDFSLTLSSSLLITNIVSIDGGTHNVSLSGNNSLRIFTVSSGGNLTLKSMALTGGKDRKGGALYVPANAQATVTNCTFNGNHAVGAAGTDGTDGTDGSTSANGNGGNGTAGTSGADGLGGAIYNLGTIGVFNCTFSSNSAAGGSGGNGGNGGDSRARGLGNGGSGGKGGNGGNAYGGSIFNGGTANVTACTLMTSSVLAGNGGSGGTNGAGPGGLAGVGGAGGAASGAGVYSLQVLALASCTLSANAAQGGASAAGGTQENGNGTDGLSGGRGSGGGVTGLGVSCITNCTFSGDACTGGAGGNGGNGSRNGGIGGNGGNGVGGGIYATGRVFVVNCTLANCGVTGGTNGEAGNRPGSAPGNPGNAQGAAIAKGAGSFTVMNTLLAPSASGPNLAVLAGTLTDSGYNLAFKDSSSGLLNNPTDIKTNDVGLGPLANNGGPTLTMALATNSPAIDRIPSAFAPPTDQRGALRPPGSLSDIGAYEFIAAPVIVAQPQNQTNVFGGNVSFTVSVFGDAPRFQWRFNTNLDLVTNLNDLTNFIVVPNATNATLSFSGVSVTNAGNYFVAVSNQFGSAVSSNALLYVGPHIASPLAISTVPVNNPDVRPGDHVVISAVVQGSSPLSYQWYYNQTNIVTDVISNAVVVNFELDIPGVQVVDMGSYSLSVSNLAGSVTSAPVSLVVDGPPVVTSQPTDQNVLIGSPVTFTSAAIGPPVLQYQWFFNQTNFIAGARSPSLPLAAAQLTNIGFYSVTVSNANFGWTNSLPAFLNVGVFGSNGAVQFPGYEALGVFVSGNFAYLALSNSGSGAGLLGVVDVTTNSKPQVVGSVPLPGARRVFVAGGYAYVACGASGLAIVDVQSATNPVPVSATTNLAAANGIWVSSMYAYVADGVTGLNIIDIGDPRKPTWLTNRLTGGTAVDVQVANGTAYLVASAAGLQILDVSSVTNPVVTGAYTNGGAGASSVGVRVSGNFAYVAQSDAGLEVIDVSDRTHPASRGTNSNLSVTALDLGGLDAFVPAGNGGVIAMNIGSATNSFFAGTNAIPGGASAVAVSGRNVYAGSGDGRLIVLDAGSAFDGAPQILVQPQSVSLLHGSNAVLGVTVSGSTPMGFLWQRSGVPLTNGDPRFLGTTAAALTIASAHPSDSDLYTVVVSNPFGVVTSAVAQLSVTGCVYTLSAPAVTNISGAFVSSFTLVTSNECDWMVSSTNSWIHLTNTGASSGSGTIYYMVDANSDTNSRAGAITVGTTNLVITQAGVGTTNVPFVKGTFTGLFFDTTNGISQQSSGFFKVVSTAKGKFTASFQVGSARFSVSGQFDGNGFFTTNITTRNLGDFLISLQIQASDTDQISGIISGNLSDIPWAAELSGDRAVFDSRLNNTTKMGLYTVALPGDVTSTNEPGGDSWGTVSVTKAGAIHLAGALSDGTKFSQGATLSKDLQWPLYVSLYGGKGSLLSWLTFTNTGTNDLNGLVNWNKPPMKAKYYGTGFTVQTNASGSHYVKPPKGTTVLKFTDADIVLIGGGYDAPLTNQVTLGSNNKATSATKATLTFVVGTGAFRGSVRNSADKPISFSGVALTDTNLGTGYFLGTNRSGRVLFQGH